MQSPDDAFELTVRRDYAAITPNLEALSLWVSNTLNEFRKHDDMIYDVQIRQKEVHKLLEKVKGLQQNGIQITSFKDVTEHVHDLVGTRVIVHVLREVPTLHATFMSDAPFNIRQLTIHYSDDINQSILDDIKETSSVGPVWEKNERGYFCVHYVIEPILRGEIFRRSKNAPYQKFELQLRTLLNHAWAEMHHRAVLKSQLGDAGNERLAHELENRFADLSTNIQNCDRLLDKICRPLFMSPTFKFPLTQASLRLKPYLDEIQTYIRQFEDPENPLAPARRHQMVKHFSEENRQVIQENSRVTNDNVDFNTDLAELYLKGYHNDLAYELYLKCEELTNKDGVVWLRLAETCSSMVEKEDEVKKYVRKVAEKARSCTEVTEKDSLLYASAAIIAWEYECLEDAVLLGETSLRGEIEEYSPKSVRMTANLIYYKLDYIRNRHPDNVDALEKCVKDLGALIVRVTADRSAEHLWPHDYDTVAWYHFCEAEIASAKNDVGKARTCLRLAEDYMEKCSETWNSAPNNVKRAEEEIARNKARIAKLRKALDLRNPKVFISYSHTDQEWLKKLRKHLKPLERQGAIDVWDDTKIKTSAKWADEIRAALASSKVAIVLVSADYLASEFINNEELPNLLISAENEGGVRIIPVILSPCRFLETPSLSRFHAANPPSKPLKGMSEVDQDYVLYGLSKEIEDIIK